MVAAHRFDQSYSKSLRMGNLLSLLAKKLIYVLDSHLGCVQIVFGSGARGHVAAQNAALDFRFDGK